MTQNDKEKGTILAKRPPKGAASVLSGKSGQIRQSHQVPPTADSTQAPP